MALESNSDSCSSGACDPLRAREIERECATRTYSRSTKQRACASEAQAYLGTSDPSSDLLAVPGGRRGVDRVVAEVGRVVAEVGRAADTVVADDGRWAGAGR